MKSFLRIVPIIGTASMTVAFLSWFAGCSQTVTENLVTNSDLESPLEIDGLPRGWKLSTSAGTYKVAVTAGANSGKVALAVAGAGGETQLLTNVSQVPDTVVLEAEAWVQADQFKEGEASVSVTYSSSADEPEGNSGKTVIPIDKKSREWQKLHFLSSPKSKSKPLFARLAFKLNGQGLIRVDDLLLKKVATFQTGLETMDGSFERLAEDGSYPDWEYCADKPDESSMKQCNESPADGAECLRLAGPKGWSVIYTKKSIPSKVGTVFLQGFVRVQNGEGHIKLEYVKDGKNFEATYSPRVHTNEWTFVTATTDSYLLAQADSVRVTLGASSDSGPFSVDFDAIEVIASK